MEPITPKDEFDSWKMSWIQSNNGWKHPFDPYNKDNHEAFIAMIKAIMIDTDEPDDGFDNADEYPEALELIMNAYYKHKKITP